MLIGLAVAGSLYGVGRWRLDRRSNARTSVPAWRMWCYIGGLAALGFALLSPIATFTPLLFSMHMVQHLLLVQVAAPLIWLGAPLLPLLWGLPERLRWAVGSLLVPTHPVSRLGHILTISGIAAGLHLATVTIWHIPSFYDAAQGRSILHDIEHILFLGTALLYWWPVIHPKGGTRRLGYGWALLYLLPLMLLETVIGALLTLADRPLYETYRLAPRVSPLSALQDQQLAGLIMWVPGGMSFLVPLFGLLTLALRQEERTNALRERIRTAEAP